MRASALFGLASLAGGGVSFREGVMPEALFPRTPALGSSVNRGNHRVKYVPSGTLDIARKIANIRVTPARHHSHAFFLSE
jgi:hypothetical protein